MERWIGKVAIVTGASSGIGEATSRAFVGAGLNVLGLARREDKLQKISNSLKGNKGSFHYARCDVRNENDILNAFAYAEKELGGVDVLVSNAGFIEVGRITDKETDYYHKIFDVNVIGAAVCTREALKSMRKRQTEGHIFYINSIFGLNTRSSHALNLYPSTKFALRAMAQTLKQEIQINRDKIRITGLHPGLVKTEIASTLGIDDKKYDFVPHLKSEHIADCVTFALSLPLIFQMDEMVCAPLHERL